MLERSLFDIADHELHGVGDAVLGEWREVGDKAVHVRRRVTDREAASAGITSVVDVRSTDEAARRIHRMRPFLPPVMQQLPDEAFP